MIVTSVPNIWGRIYKITEILMGFFVPCLSVFVLIIILPSNSVRILWFRFDDFYFNLGCLLYFPMCILIASPIYWLLEKMPHGYELKTIGGSYMHGTAGGCSERNKPKEIEEK